MNDVSEKISESSKEEVKHLKKGNALDKNGVKAEMSKNKLVRRSEMIREAFSMIISPKAQALEMAAVVEKRSKFIREQEKICQELTEVAEKHHRAMRGQEELAKEGVVEMRHTEGTRSLHLGRTEELDLRKKRFCDAVNKAIERGAAPGQGDRTASRYCERHGLGRRRNGTCKIST